MGTAAGATLVAAAVFPDESREFWTSALWDTNRVGVLSYVSNQSLRGYLARLPIDAVATYLWLVVVLAVLALWAWRVRRAGGDVYGGLALTGVLGCLISPVSWVHHCVWLLPALVRCVDAGLAARDRRRLLYLGVAGYLLMTSRLLWVWEKRPRPPLELLGANIYVYLGLAFLIWMPLTPADPDPGADVREVSAPRRTVPS
jgi:alpha-1,2-mannosyltransferase